MKFFIVACLFVATAFADDNASCREDLKNCVLGGGDRAQCVETLKQCLKNKVGPKIQCLNQCKEDVKKCIANSNSIWDKLKCAKPARECAMKCASADEPQEGLLFDAEEGEVGDKCVDIYRACMNGTKDNFVNRLKCGAKYLKCRLGNKFGNDEVLLDDADTSCTEDMKNCVLGGGSTAQCAENYRQCLKNKAQPKLDCLKQCAEVVKKCIADSNSVWDKLKCAKPAKECAVKCASADEPLYDDLLFDVEDADVSCRSEVVQCLRAENSSKSECMKEFGKCVAEKAKAKGRCVKQCHASVKDCRANATSIKEKFNCWRSLPSCIASCRNADEPEIMFDEDEDSSCRGDLKTCMSTEGSKKSECLKQFGKCVADKIKEKTGSLQQCIQTCASTSRNCLASADGIADKVKCVGEAVKCGVQCRSNDEPEIMMDEDESPKCVQIYRDCVNKTGGGFVNRMKCGQKYLECLRDEMKEKAKEKFGPKIKCVKDCRAAFKQCRVNNGTLRECAKSFGKCVAPCRNADEPIEDELFFDGEEKGNKCIQVYRDCVNANGKDFVNRLKCGKKFYGCLKNETRDKFEPKVKCVKECRAAFKQCRDNNGTLRECVKLFGKCVAPCRKADESIEDELFFDGEEKGDKCVQIYRDCVNANGKDFVNRMKCGAKYLECRKDQLKEKAKPYVDCIKKCKNDVYTCYKSGTSKKECFKKGFECAKACKKA